MVILFVLLGAVALIPALASFNMLSAAGPLNVHRWCEERSDAGLLAVRFWSIFIALLMFAAARGSYNEFLHPYRRGAYGWFQAILWIGLVVGIPLSIKLLLPARDDHGSATLMGKQSLGEWKKLAAGNGIILGRSDDTAATLMKYEGDAHLLTIAPTRSGKGVSAIIPNLLAYKGSVLVIDPKGENARVTARQRQRYGKTHILDPFGVTGLSTASYNPLARITPDNPDAADDAAALADALVIRGKDGDSHWDDEAASFLEGVILFVALHEAPERRHLGTVREIITSASDKFDNILEIMRDCGGLVERTANRFQSKSDREASSVLSTAQRHTKFLDSDRMQKVLASSEGIDFGDLKRAMGTSIFLCIPPDRLDTYGRWLRLMVNEALMDMATEATKPKMPVLFLLDEFAALGAMASVKRAMGLMAGYGMILWPFLQDLSQLKSQYGEAALTFFANAGAIQFFGVNDLETAKHVSDTIGQTTMVDASGSAHGRNLIMPDELMRLRQDIQLVMLKGRSPAALKKLRYFEEPEFSGMWDADPLR